MFLYRHALELALKSLLVQCQNATGIRTEKILERGHRLSQMIPDLRSLKERFRTAFRRVEVGGMTLGDVEAVLLEWDQYDGNAETFRYSMRKNGKATLPDEDFMINLEVFSATMDAVLDFVLAVDGAVFDELVSGWSDTESSPREVENGQR